MADTVVVHGAEIAAYGFGDGHPFGTDRHSAFMDRLTASPIFDQLASAAPRLADEEELGWFHTDAYCRRVRAAGDAGSGYLDGGDTPVVPGIYTAARNVVGASLVATEAILDGRARHGFVPIAGLHHAARDSAAGFCVFNDCAVAIEWARRRRGLERVAYVDIDAHHGDGVYYGFHDDPGVIFADIHEDGRYLYPGTGSANEVGVGEAEGTKLNLPRRPGSDDADFMEAWQAVERHLRQFPPQLFILQCGADSLAGDPITHMAWTEASHAHAAARLAALADEFESFGVLALGGGGYNRHNLARAWTAVVEALARA